MYLGKTLFAQAISFFIFKQAPRRARRSACR